MLHDIIIFACILAIISVPMLTSIILYRRYAAHEKEKLELQLKIEEAKAEVARSPVGLQAGLAQRLQVLEAIATDPASGLAEQIEDLRLQMDAASQEARA